MYSEHLQNVRLTWILVGWAVAAAVTSLVFLVFVSIGVLGVDLVTDALWAAVALAIGFLAGGFFIGTRAVDAPLLHGIGIGLTSLLAWFLLNVLVDLLFGQTDWAGLSPTLTAALLLEQLVAAVAGTWVGHRLVLRGGDEMAD